MKPLLVFYFLLFTYLASAPVARAHPGRLDENGCHEVRADYEYESGKVLKKGTHHCHRPLGKMRLDGKELLEDPRDQGMPTKERRRLERKGME